MEYIFQSKEECANISDRIKVLTVVINEKFEKAKEVSELNSSGVSALITEFN